MTRLRLNSIIRCAFLRRVWDTRSLLVVRSFSIMKCSGSSACITRGRLGTGPDEEVAFLVSIAMQLAIGYQYTRIYNDKKREAETTKALLEIANALNARSDFGEVTSAVWSARSRSWALTIARWVCLMRAKKD